MKRDVIEYLAKKNKPFVMYLRSGDHLPVTAAQLEFPSEYPEVVVVKDKNGMNKTFFEAAVVVSLKQ